MVHRQFELRCKALDKKGNPCRAAVTEGGLCFFHSNPGRASELGRKGGARSHRRAIENADPVAKLETATAVRDGLAQLIADVYADKISPRKAAVLTPLLNLQLRAIESSDLEARVAKLEKDAAAEDRAVGEPGPPQIEVEYGNLPNPLGSED